MFRNSPHKVSCNICFFLKLINHWRESRLIMFRRSNKMGQFANWYPWSFQRVETSLQSGNLSFKRNHSSKSWKGLQPAYMVKIRPFTDRFYLNLLQFSCDYIEVARVWYRNCRNIELIFLKDPANINFSQLYWISF